MGLREDKRDELRRTIVDTAIGLFRAKGYDGTRIQEIVAQVRISEATFFNHFPSKEALLDQFTLDTVDRYMALLRHELLDDARPVPDRIRKMVVTIGRTFAADRSFMAVVAVRSNLFYGATDLARERHLGAYKLLAELFRQGQQRGEIRRDVDSIQLAEVLTAAYMLTIANWLIGWWDHGGALEPRLAKAIDVVLSGCSQTRVTASRSRAQIPVGKQRRSKRR
jgi:AcrR family transcriptional regulator